MGWILGVVLCVLGIGISTYDLVSTMITIPATSGEFYVRTAIDTFSAVCATVGLLFVYIGISLNRH